MNIFRFGGDILHLLSIALVLIKLRRSKNCIGISCRMQEIYLIVFICRYIDLLYNYISLYNTIMKILFILSTSYTIYLIRYKPPISLTYKRNTYKQQQEGGGGGGINNNNNKGGDNFPYEKYLVPPCLLLSLLTCDNYSLVEVLWTFSIWLESVAIIPQLLLLQQMREIENLTSNYVACMGLYRFFYILNWVYRYFYEPIPYVNYVGWIAGFIQTALYLDFFFYYAVAKWYGEKLILPVHTDV